MSTKAPFCVEYAKSGRSSCKTCQNPIGQGTPRIGKLERSERFDGEIYEYRHPKCFFDNYSVAGADLSGLADLKWDDQQKLAKKCTDGGGGAVGGTAVVEDVDDGTAEWLTELAKSNRSTCKGCASKIEKNELRVAKKTTQEDTGYSTTNWYHVACVKLPSYITDADQVSGYSSLDAENKKLIDAQMQALGAKRKTENKEQSEAAKKAKKEAEEAWKTKEKLQKDYTKDELRAILHLTEQSGHGGPSEILNRVADCMLYGSLPVCPECGNKKLTRAAEKVVCEAHSSEWSKCTFSVSRDDPKVARGKWKMPKRDDIEEEVESYKTRKAEEKAKEKEMIAATLGAEAVAKPSKKKKAVSESDDDDDDDENEYEDMSVKELKEECSDRGLSTSGKKADLIARLVSDDGGGKAAQPAKKAKIAPVVKPAEPPKNYTKMTIKELKEELTTKSLPTNGTKKELVERLEKAAAESSSAAVVAGPKAVKVDPRSGFTDSTATVMQSPAGFPFSIMLTKSDMGVGMVGINSFYKTQALQLSKSKFVVYSRWGRVGEEGNIANKEFPSGDKALTFFLKNFQEKTGNTWLEYEGGNFEKKPGKSIVVDVEEGDGKEDDAPLGRLSKEQIEKGQGVLARIETEINGDNNSNKLKDLSSEFFTRIPTDFGGAKPVPITTIELLRAKEELLKFYLRMGFEDMKEDKGLTPISGVMDLPLPATLKAAAEKIAPEAEITRCLTKGGELADKQAGKPLKKMNSDLYGSILLYTGNAIYAALNKALREEDRSAVSKYFKYLRLLLESFTFLPAQKGKLYRGISVDLYDTYKVGSTITWWSVSSTTSEQKVARDFCGGCGGACTFITIEASSAMDIAPLSFYASEKESLLAPGTMLKVKSSKRVGKVTEIEMVEVGRALH